MTSRPATRLNLKDKLTQTSTTSTPPIHHATVLYMDPRSLPVPTLWRHPIAAWLGHHTASGHSPKTIESRRSQISTAARRLGPDPWSVTADDIELWASGQHWSRETRRGNYAALRGFYRWAVAAGHLDQSPAERLPPVKASDPAPRPAPDAVYAAALQGADHRTGLILRFAAEAGLRRGEIAQIHTRDLSEDLYGPTLAIHGKGDKNRTIPIPPDLARTVLDANGHVFPGDDNGHLSPRWVGKLATWAIPGEWTLHTLRHRFATQVYRGSGDILAVQTLLGHSSPATTQRYVLVASDRLRATAHLAWAA
jgi:integrase